MKPRDAGVARPGDSGELGASAGAGAGAKATARAGRSGRGGAERAGVVTGVQLEAGCGGRTRRSWVPVLADEARRVLGRGSESGATLGSSRRGRTCPCGSAPVATLRIDASGIKIGRPRGPKGSGHQERKRGKRGLTLSR